MKRNSTFDKSGRLSRRFLASILIVGFCLNASLLFAQEAQPTANPPSPHPLLGLQNIAPEPLPEQSKAKEAKETKPTASADETEEAMPSLVAPQGGDNTQEAATATQSAQTLAPQLGNFDFNQALLDIKSAKLEAEKAKLEAEKAKVEAEAAKVEAMKAKLEAERAKMAAVQSSMNIGGKERGSTISQSMEIKEHKHEGLFFRLTPGLGFAAFLGNGKFGGYPKDVESLGGAVKLEMTLGGRVAENLLLHGDMWTILSTNNADYVPQKTNLGLFGLGMGVTYYFMPSNMFITGKLSLANARLIGIRDAMDILDSNYGIALEATFGKEWWVSENWAIGLAGQLLYAYTTDTDISFHTLYPGLILTISYN